MHGSGITYDPIFFHKGLLPYVFKNFWIRVHTAQRDDVEIRRRETWGSSVDTFLQPDIPDDKKHMHQTRRLSAVGCWASYCISLAQVRPQMADGQTVNDAFAFSVENNMGMGN